MRILDINYYKDNNLKLFRVFFIKDTTFKYNGRRLFKSEVSVDYYTTELIRALKL